MLSTNKISNHYLGLIICEDEKSSVFYWLSKLQSQNIATYTIDENQKNPTCGFDVVGLGKAPITLVNYTINKSKKYNIAALEEGRNPYTEVFCVMDIDDHETLMKSLRKIEKVNKRRRNICPITPILSNECFELWYVLHFLPYSTRELYRKKKGLYISPKQRLDKLLSDFLGENYDKSEENIYNLILKNGGNEKKAIENARRLVKFQEEIAYQKPPFMRNPYTNIFLLIERINYLGFYF